MQKCTNCGSELPDDARYCGLCGHEPGRVSTIDKETMRSNAEIGQQPGDVMALSTHELAQSEESKNGKHADDVAALSTKELAVSEKVRAVKEGNTTAENDQDVEDVTMLDTQGLAGDKEAEAVKASEATAENGQQAVDVAELSTQELASGKERERETVNANVATAENEQQAEDVTAVDTQGLVHSKEKELVEGSTPGVVEADEVYVPHGFSEVDKVQTQGELLQTRTDKEGDQTHVQAAAPIVSPQSPQSPQPLPTSPPQHYPSSPAPKARRGSAVRWVMIAVVCLLVLAGVASGLLFLLHSQGTTTTVTPPVGTSPTVSNTVGTTPSSSNCPKNSLAASCITPVTGSTPVVGTKAVFNITLSGALQGPMTVTSMARCGPTTSGTEYDLYFSGTSGGATYNFVARIPAYKGPADYNTGQISVVFAQQPIATAAVWGNSGNVPAKATINADTKSGTLDITLTGATNTLHVSGDWVCAL